MSSSLRRPNWFLAIRLSSKSLYAGLEEMQRLVAQVEGLDKCCVPIQKSHVTLHVFHVQDQDRLKVVQQLLQEAMQQFRDPSKRPLSGSQPQTAGQLPSMEHPECPAQKNTEALIKKDLELPINQDQKAPAFENPELPLQKGQDSLVSKDPSLPDEKIEEISAFRDPELLAKKDYDTASLKDQKHLPDHGLEKEPPNHQEISTYKGSSKIPNVEDSALSAAGKEASREQTGESGHLAELVEGKLEEDVSDQRGLLPPDPSSSPNRIQRLIDAESVLGHDAGCGQGGGSIPVHLKGLGRFGLDVLFVKMLFPHDSDAHRFRMLWQILADHLLREDFISEKEADYGSFHPHITIMKTSRKRAKRPGIRTDTKELFNTLLHDHEERDFGHDQLSSVQLLSMTQPAVEGYYFCQMEEPL